MKVKKTIWIPAVIGVISTALIVSASEANFFIPLGNDSSMGIGELFTTLSAALGGPIAAIVTIVMVYGTVSILHHVELFPDTTSAYIMLADAIAHLCAMLVLAVCYYKLIYPRARKTGIFLAGWFLTVGIYYYVVLLPLEVVLLNLVDPGYGATYPVFAKNFIPEFLGTAAITTLVWFAAPNRYRRPQWVKPKSTTEQDPENSGE